MGPPKCRCTTARFMPVKEAAIVLPVSEEYLYAGLRTRRFPGAKFGRVRALLRSFVDDFVAQVETGRFVEFEDYAAAWHAKNNEVAV